MTEARNYNDTYSGDYLNRVAFPLGGIGAGMMCLEGTGALSHFSLRHKPDVFHEPIIFSAVHVKGESSRAKVLEGPVPAWKIFGNPKTGGGASGKTYGLPRFSTASFNTRFPFATVSLEDEKMPLKVEVTGWSPFIPGDADDSSLPTAALEYRFTNPTDKAVEAIYSFHAINFMATRSGGDAVQATTQGFVLWQEAPAGKPWEEGAFAASVNSENASVNCAMFRGGWFDPLQMTWKNIEEGSIIANPPVTEGDPSGGGSIYVPLELAPGEEKAVQLMFSWYVPKSDLRISEPGEQSNACCEGGDCCTGESTSQLESPMTYEPWYARRFSGIDEVADYWRKNYGSLRDRTLGFTECFYDTTLPPEVVEAAAANLTILKSPTVLRQADGRLWCWEGCHDDAGCCSGTCTHVWNYAQALPHLFPDLERTLRQTEFNECQDEMGHQNFRAPLPIRPASHAFHAAADGQLGNVMKVYREWRISGDAGWMRSFWPKVKACMDYCVTTWDPDHQGVLVEPHHNTYDIEFWGPNGMCSSFYLGALQATINMGDALGEDVSTYRTLLERGRKFFEEELYDGEYFYQKVQWQGLHAGNPAETQSLRSNYSTEALELLEKEGPKYQYGTGCLSDGVLGAWMATVCGLDSFLDEEKVRSHLLAVYTHNLKRDLTEHANPQRPSYAVGNEGGLLLCSWPKGGRPSLPFVYSDEVWTGIEYQVASHLMLMGMIQEGLEIVRICRDRYDGRVRNPFNEYECGHWYGRAMASYGLLQGLTGIRYDAVEKTLFIEPRIEGDFRSFFATATGYGTAGVKDGEPFVEVKSGSLEVEHMVYS